LNVGDLTADYNKVKQQWTLLSVAQWEHWAKLRQFVKQLDDWIESTSNLPTDCHKQSFFNVILTVFVEVLREIPSIPLLLFIGSNLFQLFVTEKVDNGSQFVLSDGRVLSFVETESFVFGCAKLMLKIIGEGIPPNSRQLGDVRERLQSISPSTLALLDDHGRETLKNCYNQSDLLFAERKNKSEVWLLFAYAITYGKMVDFRRDLLCTVLVLLQEKLQKVKIGDEESFQSTLISKVGDLSASLLAFNIFRLKISSI
jgi:hypothetical protein